VGDGVKIPYSKDLKIIEQARQELFDELVKATGIEPGPDTWRTIAYKIALSLPEMQVESKRGPKVDDTYKEELQALVKAAQYYQKTGKKTKAGAAKAAGRSRRTLERYQVGHPKLWKMARDPKASEAVLDFLEFYYVDNPGSE